MVLLCLPLREAHLLFPTASSSSRLVRPHSWGCLVGLGPERACKAATEAAPPSLALEPKACSTSALKSSFNVSDIQHPHPDLMQPWCGNIQADSLTDSFAH
eukprot:GHVU01038532.1.p2 GENE.GHVU01038532.1~~GHVU01038532.1.p2  ORF type:complete len:101 (+),score=0.03 GHVU01038532.1:1291-1593(+)